MKKVGVMIPTYKRPDLLRRAVLQWIVQTRKPDILCIHQNGSDESYEWVINDLKDLIPIKWIHVPKDLPQNMWYYIPLTQLIQEGCDVFLWADHDDIFYSNHVKTVMDNLEGYDITVSDTCGILYVKDKAYKYSKPAKFNVNPTGGMASSISFTRKLALDLQLDLIKDKERHAADNVLAFETMPKNQVRKTSSSTTVYVSHAGTVSTSSWPDNFVKE